MRAGAGAREARTTGAADVNLSTHFTLAEFTASDTASGRGIDNSLPGDLLGEAQHTCLMLEAIRKKLGDAPVVITSGYRCPDLNAAVGSQNATPTTRGSDHLYALAVDFKCPDFGTPLQICRALEPHLSELGIGQLIHEFGQWVHVSTRPPAREVNRVITITHSGTFPGVVPA